MKVFPSQHLKQLIKEENRQLTPTEKVTKNLALLAAFGTVSFFFFKILFF